MIKKTVKYWVVIMCILTTAVPVSAAAAPQPLKVSDSVTYDVQPRAITWVYKKINGKLYKRLYDQVTNKWIGNWIPV